MKPDWHILFSLWGIFAERSEGWKLLRLTLSFLLVLGSLAPVSTPGHPRALQSPITANGDDPKIGTGG